MPIPLVAEAFQEGLSKIPYAYTILKTLPWFGGLYGLKSYFAGASNLSERNMHSKVVIMTVSYQKLNIRRVLIIDIRAEHQA
jgi:Leu/Phe-tRNA-protein transferase